jgi:hypothetical protein
MPLKELFEAAWNDEPILSDEVAVLGNSVQVTRPSRPLRRGGLRFTHCWCRFQEGERGRMDDDLFSRTGRSEYHPVPGDQSEVKPCDPRCRLRDFGRHYQRHRYPQINFTTLVAKRTSARVGGIRMETSTTSTNTLLPLRASAICAHVY